MITLTQKHILNRLDGTVKETEIIHIYAPHGHFLNQDGLPTGCHIQLGANGNAADYTEVDTGVECEIPAFLRDLVSTETDAEITDSDALHILLGGK